MISQGDISLLDGFERALINGRLHMAYQPKISLADGSLKGYAGGLPIKAGLLSLEEERQKALFA